MGLLDFFKKNNDGQFVTEKQFKESVSRHVDMAPETLNQLRQIGVTDDQELKLEFFFYANTEDKVKNLSSELSKMNYEVEFGKSQGDKKLFISTGWTAKMRMDNNTVAAWTREMCQLGYKFDCEFDGWGTTPDQD